MAQQVAKARQEPFVPLDKDALSRLRRFYSRRSMADLRLENMTDEAVKSGLARLAKAIRANEVQQVVKHEMANRQSGRPPET